ncbi:MAG: adenylate/guanylate cyclase domain-containing protein [Desulfuromonadales bacterium]|nr:adenylate/guanylate cyclase domain-containing protein [Desulfuromonadales bacterium]
MTTTSDAFFAVRDGDIVGRTGVGHELLNPHEEISRKHAQFIRKRDEWFIVDLNSSNGTFLDDSRISPKIMTPLRDGQRLGFSAAFTVTVNFAEQQPAPSTAVDSDAENRQTLVILFADIKGSVDFFQEMGTLVARNWIFKLFRMLTGVIAIHDGKHLKNIGDALLAVFPDPVEAARAAQEMQSIIREYNKGVDPSHSYAIRIGMNVGSVLYENNDVFGNAVNIASRVQGLTPPGRIFITRELYNAIRQEPGINPKFIGEEELKGVKQAIGIYELSASSSGDNKITYIT